MKTLHYDAVIFDLDGVVTDTAKVHAAAWKALFDDYLQTRTLQFNEPFRPFDIEEDYASYLDGKPRYDGVECFLRSRGIVLAHGDPANGPERETVCGLGNRKDRIFSKVLRENGVDVFDSTVRLARELEALRIWRAVASSSKNCRSVLQIAGLGNLFDTMVDGLLSADLSLKGKPNPDIFLKCGELLGAAPERTVVVEDAISGVQAGRDGGFGLVIGIDRAGLGAQLQKNGADVVVTDLLNVDPYILDSWFRMKHKTSGNIPFSSALHTSSSVRKGSEP